MGRARIVTACERPSGSWYWPSSHRLSAQTAPNTLTAAERAAGWRLLFDGKTLNGWRGLGYDSVPTAHWRVVNGTIEKLASGNVPKIADGQPLNGGDLMTIDAFHDFELSFQWKVAPGREQRREIQRLRGILAGARVEPRGARVRVSGTRRFAERRQQDPVALGRIALRSHRTERRVMLPPVMLDLRRA